MQRRIRSFVRRTGRLTPGQESALRRLWPRFGLEYREAHLELDTIFRRAAERVLEIGFGNGESLAEQAQAHPDLDFIGIEVHEPGIGHCLLTLESRDIRNVRLICHDAVDVLTDQVPDGGLARINLYFPDPWPKKRHHKRRIVQDEFLELAALKLAASGRLCIATDWANYAEHIDSIVARSTHFEIAERRQHRGDRPLDRATTKFERRGLDRGHDIYDWQIARI